MKLVQSFKVVRNLPRYGSCCVYVDRYKTVSLVSVRPFAYVMPILIEHRVKTGHKFSLDVVVDDALNSLKS